MSLAKVLARGQVTLPREIRRAVCVQPGDTVLLRVTAPDTVELKVLPRLRLSEALERYRIEGGVDLDADRASWQAEAARDVIEPQDE